MIYDFLEPGEKDVQFDELTIYVPAGTGQLPVNILKCYFRVPRVKFSCFLLASFLVTF